MNNQQNWPSPQSHQDHSLTTTPTGAPPPSPFHPPGGVIAMAPAGAHHASYTEHHLPAQQAHQSVVVPNNQQNLKSPSANHYSAHPYHQQGNHNSSNLHNSQNSFANLMEGGASSEYNPFNFPMNTPHNLYSPTDGSGGFMSPWPGGYANLNPLSPSWPYMPPNESLDQYLYPTGAGNPLIDLLPPIGYSTDSMPRAPAGMVISSYGSNYIVQAKKRAGGRRPKEEEETLGPEEQEKRKLRRIRNKEAAARCRQRRLNHMNALQAQVDALVQENQLKEEEIDALRQEKAHLEELLQNHTCVVKNGDSTINTPAFLNAASMRFKAKQINKNIVPTSVSASNSNLRIMPPPAPVKMEPGDPTLTQANAAEILVTTTTDSLGGTVVPGLMRPVTLSFETPTTPSKEFVPFDLLGQSTGLTPVTNTGLTPILTLGGSIVTTAGASLETPTTMDTTSSGLPAKPNTTLCNL